MPVKKPKTRCGGRWTEASYWSFIRSGLRRKFICYPVQYDARNAARRKYTGSNKNQKWEYQCAECKEWHPQKETQVHHVKDCGSLKSYDDLPAFVERLFCEADGLAVVCKKCHKGITAEQRANKAAK